MLIIVNTVNVKHGGQSPNKRTLSEVPILVTCAASVKLFDHCVVCVELLKIDFFITLLV